MESGLIELGPHSHRRLTVVERVLHEVRQDMMEGIRLESAADRGVQVQHQAMIAGVTGLSEQQARQLADQLVIEGFLLKDDGVYRFTDAGMRWVLESPAR